MDPRLAVGGLAVCQGFSWASGAFLWLALEYMAVPRAWGHCFQVFHAALSSGHGKDSESSHLTVTPQEVGIGPMLSNSVSKANLYKKTQ